MTETPPKMCPDCLHEGGYKRRLDRWMCKWCGRIWWPKDNNSKDGGPDAMA